VPTGAVAKNAPLATGRGSIDYEGVFYLPEEEKEAQDQNLTPFAQSVAKIDDARWIVYQNFGGVALGLVAGALLFLVKSDGSFLPMNFIVALAVAKFLPDYVEKQAGRSLRRARLVMVFAILATMLGYLVYIFATQGPAALTLTEP
jgi:hypothetical protein